MELHNSFDLGDFLAYLIPGCLFLSIVAFGGWGNLGTHFDINLPRAPEFVIGFLEIVLFIAMSVILGHLFSLASRFVWRNVTNVIAGDPEKAIFASNGKFFTPQLNELISSRFRACFGAEMDDPKIRRAVPRLIRSVVFTRSDHTAQTRDQIVRSRAICANLVTPMLIIALGAPFGMSLAAQGIGVAMAALLLFKQRDLDVRETKEIYLAFVVLAQESPSQV